MRQPPQVTVPRDILWGKKCTCVMGYHYVHIVTYCVRSVNVCWPFTRIVFFVGQRLDRFKNHWFLQVYPHVRTPKGRNRGHEIAPVPASHTPAHAHLPGTLSPVLRNRDRQIQREREREREIPFMVRYILFLNIIFNSKMLIPKCLLYRPLNILPLLKCVLCNIILYLCTVYNFFY